MPLIVVALCLGVFGASARIAAHFGFAFWTAAPIALLAVPVGVLFIAVSRRHAFALTPSGISRPFRRAIPWDAAARGDARRPTLSGDIDPRLLADAVRWYVEHPADRAAIGTRAELDALMARWRGVTATTA